MGVNVYFFLILGITSLSLVILFIFNISILNFLQGHFSSILVYIAGKSYDLEKQMVRLSSLRSRSILAKYYRWCNNILVNMGYRSRNITVTGYTVYSMFMALILVLVCAFIFKYNLLLCFVAFVLLLVIIGILSELRASMYLERREAVIMDTIDLLVPQLSGGVKNAVIKVMGSISPLVQLEFKQFLSNIDKSAMTFEDAMTYLRFSLGNSFDDFAQKAILFELQEDHGTIEIFSDTIEMNHIKRQLRYENNAVFAELRIQFFVSLGMIVVFSFVFASTDTYVREFFTVSNLGKFVMLADLALVTFAMGFITKIKAMEF